MIEPILLRCLQVCVSLMMASRLQGKVTAPQHMQAMVNLPFTLGCNLTLDRGETLKQVRWLDSRNITILSYLPKQPPSIMDPTHVERAPSRRDTSAITIKRVGSRDEGCYRCLFDVYPSGVQEGQTCLTVTAKVYLDGNKTAVSGKLATLSCSYGLPKKVHQVLWTKTAEQGNTSDVASFAKRGQPSVQDTLRDRVTLSHTLDETRLSIQPVRTEDEGCYTCHFHAYPEGTVSGVACLTVYVLPKPQLSHKTILPGVIEANCTALARPAAEIVWNVEGDNRTLGPPMSSSFTQEDGTTLVISTLSVKADLLRDTSVKCLVHHRGLESAISISLNTKIGKALTILISVTSVAALLILCLCICLWKCFLHKDY